MSTRLKNNDEIFDVESELLKGAERTAQRYGLNVDRVMAVYRRYLDFGRLVPPGIDIVELDQAISVIGPSKALELFENEDLRRLADRAFLVGYFSHCGDLLLCSTSELACLIEEFISHLLNNREDLLETGHPRSVFLSSLFLDWQLGKLYPLDFPTGSEAPQSEEMDRLKSGRSRLFRLKIAVLEELLQAFRHQGSTNPWERCLPLLTETVSADQAEFYLRMDKFYKVYELRQNGSQEEIPRFDRPGGFTDLLELIGYCGEELSFGALAKTRSLLGELVVLDLLKRPVLVFSNYFEAAAHPLKDVLDFAIDSFLSVEPKVRDFWQDYTGRVNRSLQNDFYVEPISGVKVTRKIMLSYELLRTFLLEPAKSHFEATGRFPWGPPSSKESKPRSDFVFRRRGDFWEIIYEGQPCEPLKDLDGLHYIVYLLAHPNEEVHVGDLYSAYKSKPLPKVMDEERLVQEGLTISRPRDCGTKLTPRATAQYRKRLKELQEEREEAESINDKGRLDKITWETEGINQQLKSGVGRRGRLREDGDIVNTHRTTVANRIKHALDKIEKENQELWRYLYSHIKTGTSCSYTPEKPIPWEL